jgi:signal peptide peptidase SppA
MKSFPHIISKLFCEPLLITRARHFAICKVVEARMARADMLDDGEAETEKDDSFQAVGNTAIIPVHGVLVRHASDIPMSACGCGLDVVENQIKVALTDKDISRIVFDFNSPGGAVTGIPELARRIAGITSKETIAYTEDECCSGALWLAEQCQRFYSTESASIGSIGVWTAYLDISRQMANEGENMQAISAGKYKLLGAYWKPLADDEKKMLQASVDKIFEQFKSAVNSRREIASEYMEGQIFDGVEAAQIGLIDGLVDGLDELIGDEH